MMDPILPWLGYLASIFLVAALLVNNDLKFRWFSAAGNLTFITYALFLEAYPVLITNLILLGLNAWYLIKVYSRQENFEMLEFTGEERMARQFMAFYSKDMALYFPDFVPEDTRNNFNFVVLRDLVIANMFSARLEANGDAVVSLNYTLERYRDYKVGTYIFEKERDFLLAKGIKRIVYQQVENKGHLRFLKRMGFRADQATGHALVKTLV